METVQLNKRSDGKIMATAEQKQAVIDLVNSGAAIAEVASAHGLTTMTLVKWRRSDVKRAMRFEKQPEAEVTPQTHLEMLAEIRRLAEENQKLRKSIGNIACERDILQEAVSIAAKKVDLARSVIGLKKFKVRKVCSVLKVARSNQYAHRSTRAHIYKRKDDPQVLKSVLEITKTRGTDGYPRVTARINRERRKQRLPSWNGKRIYRVMKITKLLEPKRMNRHERLHLGKIIVMRSNVRYCSDIFQIQCWNGESVNVAFSLDCCDREAMSFVAERRALFHEDIIELIDQTVSKRFGDYAEKLPHEIEWLSDRGPQYTAENTKAYAREWGFKPITAPSYSPESNGMAEGFVKLFKRDYVNTNNLWAAEAVIRQLPGWFADYNENHPHSGLKMRSPVEFRLAESEAATRSV